MARPKLRVLLDLSMAARGHNGIAQDVRLLYKVFASCPDVEVTGLVYQPRKLAALHKFRPPDAPRGERLANQSSFLWSLTHGTSLWPNVGPWRVLKRCQQAVATVCAYRARLDRLETDPFWQVIWRSLFSHTLSPDDIDLVRNGSFLLSNISDGMIYARSLSHRPPFKLDARGYDFMIVQGPRQFRLGPETRLIVRYHDMIPVTHPDTVSNPLIINWHHKAIKQSSGSSFFVCNSEPTRESLIAGYPKLRLQSATIANMLVDAYRPDPRSDQVRSIIETRRSSAAGAKVKKRLKQTPRYLMCVSTLEPRKNFIGLIQAFNAVRFRDAVRQAVPDLKLLIVGTPGWRYEPILAAMRELIACGDLIHLERVSTDELRVLYTHAEAFVFPSYAEGFGFPPLEAMQCHVPVIASDIPAHRWAMGDAALYCNPYDVASIADAIERLITPKRSPGLRAEFIARGRERVKRYSLERCSRQWLDLLLRLKEGHAVDRQPVADSPVIHSLTERAA